MKLLNVATFNLATLNQTNENVCFLKYFYFGF